MAKTSAMASESEENVINNRQWHRRRKSKNGENISVNRKQWRRKSNKRRSQHLGGARVAWRRAAALWRALIVAARKRNENGRHRHVGESENESENGMTSAKIKRGGISVSVIKA
jgi:hypothetical protein